MASFIIPKKTLKFPLRLNLPRLISYAAFSEVMYLETIFFFQNGTTALHVAASRGKIEYVSELLNFGADVNAEDLDNWSALLCAAKDGHAEVVNRLLDAGADLEHRDMGGWTALLWACYKGRTETATLLLARNADVHSQGNYNISSLIWAAGRGHSEIVRELLDHGAKAVTADKVNFLYPL